MSEKLTVHDLDGRTVELSARPDRTLAQVVYLSGYWPSPALCSGLGRCGLCRMRFRHAAPPAYAEEVRVLGADAVRDGWRLGCRHLAEAGLSLDIPAHAAVSASSSDFSPIPQQNAHGKAVVAVDLGTTSVHWAVLSSSGFLLSEGRALNPQMGAGSEVVSRIAFARAGGGAELRGAVLRLLRDIAQQAQQGVARFAIAGNPAMTALLLGLDVGGLCAAPYRLDYLGGETVALANDLPPAYILPQIAPFVGGDLSAGLTALTRDRGADGYPFLLADMGTNGEFILALSPTEFIATSVPLGPALEGIGLDFGTVASSDAVVDFRLSPMGIEAKCLADSVTPKGISGTGYLSLLALMRSVGVLEATGVFAEGETPLARRLSARFETVDGEALLPLPSGMHLAAADVEEVLKVKAAFNVAFAQLLRLGGVSPHELAAVCLAGALGEHIRPDILDVLGFLPPGAGGRVQSVGNASLRGASLVLHDAEARAFAEGVRERTRLVDLTGDASFAEKYLSCMQFEYRE